ncbi:MAG: hypothetical protein JO015_14415 [Verrucomicrobia bacterium]|nr:hypothetical protein [Verrucomicrobiota bacterium]
MSVLSAPGSAKAGSQAGTPVRSPRTSIVLAELARQRRYRRRLRRLKRLRRRGAWGRRLAWLIAFGRKSLDVARTNAVPCFLLPVGIIPLVYLVMR